MALGNPPPVAARAQGAEPARSSEPSKAPVGAVSLEEPERPNRGAPDGAAESASWPCTPDAKPRRREYLERLELSPGASLGRRTSTWSWTFPAPAAPHGRRPGRALSAAAVMLPVLGRPVGGRLGQLILLAEGRRIS